MIKAKMSAGIYRGVTYHFGPLEAFRYINKIYKGNRIVAINAQSQMTEGLMDFRVELVMKESEFSGIYAEVNEALFEDFLAGVEWELKSGNSGVVDMTTGILAIDKGVMG